MGRLGMNRFRPRDRLHALLAASAEGSCCLRTIAANERAVGGWTNDWSGRAGNVPGSRIAVPCPSGCRWRARTGSGSGHIDNYVVRPSRTRRRIAPASVANTGRSITAMIFRPPNRALVGQPDRALVRPLLPPIGGPRMIAVPVKQVVPAPVKIAIQPRPEDTREAES